MKKENVILGILIFVAIAFAVTFCVGTAHAQIDINTSGLTDTQKAELVKQADALRATAAAPAGPEKVAQWVDVGKNAGLAFASFAKEVGVAGDKFIESTTGKLVFGAIAFKMIGGPLIHFGAGFLLLAIGVPIWVWSYRKQYQYKTIFDKDTGKKISEEAFQVGGDVQTAYFFAGAAIVGVSFLAMFTF